MRPVVVAACILLLTGAFCACAPRIGPVGPSTTAISSGPQAPVNLRVSADRAQVTVGDQIRLEVITDQASDVSVDWQNPDAVWGPFEVTPLGAPATVATGQGRTVTTRVYQITTFQPGEAAIPAIEIPYRTADGTSDIVRSDPLTVTVKSVLEGMSGAAELRSIKGPVTILQPGGIQPWQVASAAGAVALMIGAAVVASRRSRLRAPALPLTPADRARQELDRIADLGLLALGDMKTHHFLISTAVRGYIEDAFGVPARTMTTEELRAALRHSDLSPWLAHLVEGLLTECDAVKFAQYVPASRRAGQALAVAYEIIDFQDTGAAALTPEQRRERDALSIR